MAALLTLLSATAWGENSPRAAGFLLDDWAVNDGYALEQVGEDLVFPTSLAAVPSPGPRPDDPKLFVAELKGSIRILTADDRLLPFAHVTTVGTQAADLDGSSQQGLAGLCLDPARGYVFATFTKLDEAGILRNHIVRFQVEPGTLGGPASAPLELDPILSTVQSAAAHQIGNCQVVSDRLFVGVGDAGRASAAREPTILLGKMLCLNVEGGPCGDGPWAASADDRRAQAYAWAVGFRNPFALSASDAGLFVAQNGIDIDGFTEVVRGGDYGWAGTDQEIAAGSSLVLVPSVSPVQMVRVRNDASWAAPADHERFLIATFGGDATSSGVVDLSADPAGTRHTPRYFVEHVGSTVNRVGGIADASDGLYLAPMLPLANGSGSLLRLRYQPEQAHPVHVSDRGTLVQAQNIGLLQSVGCTSCHAVAGVGNGMGPTLDRFGIRWRLTERLNASGYEAQVAAVAARSDGPFPAYAAARSEVLRANGLDRTWVWLKYYLQEPRFDNPEVAMPNLGLTQSQALSLRAELFDAVSLDPPGDARTLLATTAERVWRQRRPLGLGMLAGLALAGVAALLARRLASSRRQRRRPRPAARGHDA